MKHLDPERMNALLDGALETGARQDAERHLGQCGRCRSELAALAAQDELLARSLDHDPGEAYFASFADRVAARIASEARAPARAASRAPGRFGRLFTPRGIAWAGSVAAVIVVAGLVLIQARERQGAGPRNPELLARGQQTAETQQLPAGKATGPQVTAPQPEPSPPAWSPIGAPASHATRDGMRPARGQGAAAHRAGATGPRDARTKSGAAAPAANALPPAVGPEASAGGPAAGPRLESREQAKAKAPPVRMIPVRRDARGEEVPLGEPPRVGFASPPAATPAPSPPAPATAGATTLRKPGARPLSDTGAQTMAETGGRLAPGREPAAPAQKLEAASRSLSPREGMADSEPGDEARAIGGAAPSARVCGTVRDSRGRPVAGAEVALADLGRVTSTDATGAFCLDGPAGERTLSVLCPGFVAVRRTVTLAATGGTAPVEIALESVPILPPGARDALRALRAPPHPEPSAAAAQRVMWPEAVRVSVAGAESLSTWAGRSGGAAAFDEAGRVWQRVAERLVRQPAEARARARDAEMRYRAWKAGPTPVRRAAAVAALRASLVLEPRGSRSAEFGRWLAETMR